MILWGKNNRKYKLKEACLFSASLAPNLSFWGCGVAGTCGNMHHMFVWKARKSLVRITSMGVAIRGIILITVKMIPQR